VSFVARSAGGAALVLVASGGGPELQLTAEMPPRPGRGFGGGCYDWLPDGSGVVYVGADGELWLQSTAAVAAVPLTRSGPDADLCAPAVSPDGTKVVVVQGLAEVLLVELGGSVAPRRLDAGEHDFVIDPTWSPDGREVAWQAWSVPDMPWDRSVLVRHQLGSGTCSITDPGGQVQQPRCGPDGRWWWLGDATGWLNLWRDGKPLLPDQHEHGGPTWGPGQRSFALSPDGQRVAFTRNERGFGRLCTLDIDTGEVVELGKGVHGGLHWVGRRIVALRSGARTPTQVVHYDIDGTASARTVLAVGPLAGWEQVDLIEPTAVQAEAVDGTLLHARLYEANEPVGLICWIHGGPTDQWQVTFMPRLAHWLSRGWSILVPDHRGSTGHGRAYQQALRERWGELDVADTTTLLRAAQAAGHGRPASTIVMGASAGGFTALWLAGTAPELIAAAVALYPVTDLADLAERSHRFERHYTDTLVGAPGEHVDRYHERSLALHPDRLANVPLLLLHGTDDPVVPVEQSRALVAALQALGSAVEYHEYEGEGHGFRQPVNQLDEYARVAEFLARVVGRGSVTDG
jgi:dipeptidyl aminopeptidase/acylaminoacyl peptidase